MRDVVSFLRGHVDGEHADIEHLMHGKFRYELDDKARAEIKIRERVIAHLEAIAHERITEEAAEFGPRLLEETGRAYRAGFLEGLSAAIGVLDTRARTAGRGMTGRARRAALLSARAALVRLEQHHQRRIPQAQL